MKATEAGETKRMFLDIPNAAGLAGFSVRHFRRIIEEERFASSRSAANSSFLAPISSAGRPPRDQSLLTRFHKVD